LFVGEECVGMMGTEDGAGEIKNGMRVEAPLPPLPNEDPFDCEEDDGEPPIKWLR